MSGFYRPDEDTRPNILINGGMMVSQRGTTFDSTTTPTNNNDTYLIDRWVLLSQGNDIIDVTQSTDAPTGALNSISLDVETANKKFGILQIIEQKNCIGVIGDVVSLSFHAKTTGSSIGNVKAAVLSWDSTSDTVISDVVQTWGADGVTPTWTTNWTAENTPANLSVTNSWSEYKIENIAIDTASAANIAVFFWSDDLTTTLTDTLLISQAKLEKGSKATPFIGHSVGQELVLCQRYFEKSWNIDNAPGTAGDEYSAAAFAYGFIGDGQNLAQAFRFLISKRVSPTMQTWDLAGNATRTTIFNSANAQTDNVNSASGWIGVDENGFTFNEANLGATTGRAARHWTADAEM